MNRYLAFKTIVEEGSFTRAAKKLGYSQPALSHMISGLEAELGLTLLDRSRKGAKLSPDGETMLPYIEHLIENYESMLSRAHNLYTLETSIIRLSTFPGLSGNWLPKRIRKFKEMYSNVDFVIRIGGHFRNKQDILSGISDIGIVSDDNSSDIEYEKLAAFPTKAVLPVGHPLCEKSILTLSDLVKEPLVLDGPIDYDDVLKAFHNNGLYPNISFRIEDYQSILALIQEGLCVSILTDTALEYCGYNLVSRPVDPPIFKTFCIGYKKRRNLSHAAATFLDFLLEEAEGDSIAANTTNI